jgi:hypothetical protein
MRVLEAVDSVSVARDTLTLFAEGRARTLFSAVYPR